MAKFDVHAYAIVRVKVSNIEATDAIEAAKKADEQIAGELLHRIFDQKFENLLIEYAEEIADFLIDPLDEQGKIIYDQTVTLDGNFAPKK